MPFPTIHLAADHAGFEHKEVVKGWLTQEGCSVKDHGAYTHDPLDDFPDFIAPAANAVSASGGRERAIIFGGSGQGEALLANRFAHVRAGVFYGGPDEIVRLLREHNDANVLSIGARFVNADDTKRIIWDWLHAVPLADEKYNRRNHKIEALSR